MTSKSSVSDVAPECKDSVYKEITRVVVAKEFRRKSWLERRDAVFTKLLGKYDQETLLKEIDKQLRTMYGVTF